MSTKVTLKHRSRTEHACGFHLYADVLDDLGQTDGELPDPLYLLFDGVEVELKASGDRGAIVAITLPRDAAVALGLVPAQDSTEEGRHV